MTLKNYYKMERAACNARGRVWAWLPCPVPVTARTWKTRLREAQAAEPDGFFRVVRVTHTVIADDTRTHYHKTKPPRMRAADGWRRLHGLPVRDRLGRPLP